MSQLIFGNFQKVFLLNNSFRMGLYREGMTLAGLVMLALARHQAQLTGIALHFTRSISR